MDFTKVAKKVSDWLDEKKLTILNVSEYAASPNGYGWKLSKPFTVSWEYKGLFRSIRMLEGFSHEVGTASMRPILKRLIRFLLPFTKMQPSCCAHDGVYATKGGERVHELVVYMVEPDPLISKEEADLLAMALQKRYKTQFHERAFTNVILGLFGKKAWED